MAYSTPTAADLGTWLDVSNINEARADMLITQAESFAKARVNPLPEGAEAVVLSSAARAFVNPSQATSQTAGPFQTAMAFPGLYLTKSEKATLRLLAGGSSAFSIDPTPTDALEHYRDATQDPTLDDLEQNQLDLGF